MYLLHTQTSFHEKSWIVSEYVRTKATYKDTDVSRFTDYTNGTKRRLYTGSEFPVNFQQILNPISWSLKLNDAGV